MKRYNASDYNLQLRFLISLRNSEGDRENTMQFLLLFLFVFLPETDDMITWYDDKSY